MDAKGENGLGRFMWVMEHVRTLHRICVETGGEGRRSGLLAVWVGPNEREFFLYTVFVEARGAVDRATVTGPTPFGRATY